MLLAVQQLLLGRMRQPVASRGIPIGVFAINRVARMQACCQIVGLFADRSVAHRAHAAERTPGHHVLPLHEHPGALLHRLAQGHHVPGVRIAATGATGRATGIGHC
jgi:hypothetical protein